MERLNGFEVAVTGFAIVGTAWFMDFARSTPDRAPAVTSSSSVRIEVRESSSPIRPVVEDVARVSRSETHTSHTRSTSSRRHPELKSIPLPLDTDTAKGIIRSIREPVPSDVVTDSAELSKGSIVLVKVKSTWRLGVVHESSTQSTVLVRLAGRDAPPTNYQRADLRLPDTALVPYVSRSGELVSATDEVQPGMILETLRPGLRWRSVIVLRVEDNQDVAVSYIGWDRSWDEIVPRSNLRYPTGVTVD